MKKVIKIIGIIVASFVALIIGLVVLSIITFNSFPEYKVRSEEYFEANAKAHVSIDLDRKAPEAELLQIAKFFRDKYKDSRSVWIWYYVPGSEECYATSHYRPDKGFEGIVFLSQTPSLSDSEVEPANIEPVNISKWNYREETNLMDDSKIYFAFLTANNELSFAFPYNGGTITNITLRYKESENNVMLKISKGQFHAESIRVRFDDKPVKTFGCSKPSDHSTTTLFINNAKDFIKELKNSKSAIIESEFFQEGIRQLMFTTEGLEWNH
ncbi:MAG: hypothetical protein LBL24_07535 [Bacteroidales bacterium]|nr:hypothetical protein [Bacteroidales bacterium]